VDGQRVGRIWQSRCCPRRKSASTDDPDHSPSYENPIYGLIISAFEYKSVRTAEPIVLWQTRIGLAANGKGMSEALPVMVQVAGPQIGRETTKPVLRNIEDRYTTKLGELEFIGFEEDAPK